VQVKQRTGQKNDLMDRQQTQKIINRYESGALGKRFKFLYRPPPSSRKRPTGSRIWTGERKPFLFQCVSRDGSDSDDLDLLLFAANYR
jgi:hypothetical protein